MDGLDVTNQTYASQVLESKLAGELKQWKQQDEEVNAELSKLNHTLEAALCEGEVAIAEDLFFTKITLIQKLVTIAEERYKLVKTVTHFKQDPTSEDSHIFMSAQKAVVDSTSSLINVVGAIIFKKENQLSRLDEKIVQCQCQLELCLDSLNPEAKKHADDKKQLYLEREDILEVIDMLRDRQQGVLLSYELVSREMMEHIPDVQLYHPMDQLQDDQLHRRSELVEYRQFLSTSEEAKISQEKEQIGVKHEEMLAAHPAAAITDGTATNKKKPLFEYNHKDKPITDDEYAVLRTKNDHLTTLLNQANKNNLELKSKNADLEEQVQELTVKLAKLEQKLESQN
eukprot:TRINITY_DN48044_c0_g1_i1.p2 TRINITY_DN48044_c0_g1~~TRINITY_DN48044_c0_g1_i1.p2  ORF type:complete len:342 (+),score=56.70 TRINITY_DN48044_c0_g1_i1:83-1108(+)